MSAQSHVTHSVLVTGGTGDLGFFCALHIAKANPQYHVVIAARKDPNNAVQSIKDVTGQSNIEFCPLDLSTLESTRTFADRWVARSLPPIAALILNAGIQLPGTLEYTGDGIEKTFGINHVAHSLLFHLLTGCFAKDARIVVTSSGTHDPAQRTGVGNPEYLSGDEIARPTSLTCKKSGMWRYGTSKLANVMWVYALRRRLEARNKQCGSRWTVAAFDPGLMPGTGLGRSQPAIIRFVWYHVLPHVLPLVRLLVYANTNSPKQSGQFLAWTATEAASSVIDGKYMEQKRPAESSPASHDLEKQEDLWRWTIAFISRNNMERDRYDKLGN